MRMRLVPGVIVTMGLAAWSLVGAAQTPSGLRHALVDVLVWGADVKIGRAAYSLEVRAELDEHTQRWERYRSERRQPATSDERKMAYFAQVRYERRLAAVSDMSTAPALAAAYVASLQPCYEWEGYHDCPEREAVFAVQYQAAHSGGPFSEFLPLLAAHRWLCAAEGYQNEEQPEAAARSQRSYEAALSTARKSKALLVRLAADELRLRRRCFASP